MSELSAVEALTLALDECGFLDTAYPPSNPYNAQRILEALPEGWSVGEALQTKPVCVARVDGEWCARPEDWPMHHDPDPDGKPHGGLCHAYAPGELRLTRLPVTMETP